MLEDPYEYEAPPINHRPWWLDALLSLACFFTAALIIASFAGCASATRDAEVCYMKLLGTTEQGFTVAFQQCMSPEAFQKATE